MAESTPVFELDVDDAALPNAQTPQATIRLAGKVYLAKCPKDAVWASLMASANRTESGVGDRMHALLFFLDKVFGEEQSEELRKRYFDENDDLNYSHLMLARERLQEAWKGWLEERFEAIGLTVADDHGERHHGGSTVTQETATATAKAAAKKPRAKK